MGGILSGPKAPPMPTPAPEPVPTDTSAEEAKARQDALERRRRGRSGTILTSDRGLVRLSEEMPPKKTLLGE